MLSHLRSAGACPPPLQVVFQRNALNRPNTQVTNLRYRKQTTNLRLLQWQTTTTISKSRCPMENTGSCGSAERW